MTTAGTNRKILAGLLACLVAARFAPAQEPLPAPSRNEMRLRTAQPTPRSMQPAQQIDPPTVRGPEPRPWALDDLEQLALSYNPTLAQASAAIDQQRGVWRQVGLYPNPQVGYLRTDPSRAGQSRTDGVFLSQEIVTAKKRQLGQAVEAQEIRRLNWELEAQRLRVLNDLRARFYEALGAQQAVAVGVDLQRVAAEGLRVAQDLLEAEHGSRPDVLQARIQYNAVRTSLQDARYRHEAAWRQLATIVGRTDLPPAPLCGRLNGEVPNLDWEQGLAELYAASPQLRAAETRLAHARRELAREQAQPFPNLTLQTVIQRDHMAQATSVSTLLAAPLPLFNRNQGNIFHASADVREAAAEIERVRLVLRDQLADSFRRYRTSRNQVQNLREAILPDAKENLDLVQAGYRQGEFSLLHVLTARQTWFQSNLAYVEACTELQKVLVEISGFQLTGGLNPATLGAAIQTQGGMFRQRGLLNQLQESNSRQLLPATIQAIGK